MNNRERFKAIMTFKSVDRYLNSEIGLWEQTIDRWHHEGLPRGAIKNRILLWEDNYFGLDIHQYVDIDVRRPYPFKDVEIISEDQRYYTFIDEFGIKRKALKEGLSRGQRTSIDQFLEYPVKDRDSFYKWRKRFENHCMERYPIDWEDKVVLWRNRDCPLCIPGLGQFGFYGFLRRWMGTEGVSYIFYDDPALVEEMLDFLTEYIIGLLDRALKEVEIDYFMYFEDMAFKNGPLLSPHLVRKLFMPRYKRINENLRKHGVNVIFVDSDGDIRELIPLFIESGINGVVPMEVAAGMDVVDMRQTYGQSLFMMGGIDKRVLAEGKKAIEDEISKKIVPIVSEGGYIPTVDHLVPPDVPLENFLYYLELKRKALEGNL
jgi:uroporphyrinogen decarboxylase